MNAAAVRRDDGTADGQTKPGSAGAGMGAGTLHELLENRFLLARRNPRPTVDDGNTPARDYAPVLGPTRRGPVYPDRTALGGKFYGISEQVCQHLYQPFVICLQFSRRFAFGAQGYSVRDAAVIAGISAARAGQLAQAK